VRMFLAFDIGCIECGEDSEVIGMYETREAAEEAVSAWTAPNQEWGRDGRGGEHSEQVFAVDVPDRNAGASTMTPDDQALIARLLALAAQASLGPWTAITDARHDGAAFVLAPEGQPDIARCEGFGVDGPQQPQDDCNAAYIAACSPDVIVRLCRLAKGAQG